MFGTRTRLARFVGLVVVLAAAAAAVADVASGHRVRLPSSVTATYRADPGVFNGTVSSRSARCERSRAVVVFRAVEGPDVRIGSSKTNRSGRWQLVAPAVGAGDYYARIGKKNVGPRGHKHLCAAAKSAPAVVAPACGNGVIEAGEHCDDGNMVPGDGCDAECLVEAGPLCGNGIIEAGEECDDGNMVSGDGCDATCLYEAGPVCGNGIIEAGEECDDGNAVSGDGCDATCTAEATLTAAAGETTTRKSRRCPLLAPALEFGGAWTLLASRV